MIYPYLAAFMVASVGIKAIFLHKTYVTAKGLTLSDLYTLKRHTRFKGAAWVCSRRKTKDLPSLQILLHHFSTETVTYDSFRMDL